MTQVFRNCGTSRFNEYYFCDIVRLEFNQNDFNVHIEVRGNGSLGPIQDPERSRLFIGTNLNPIPYRTISFSVRESNVVKGFFNYDSFHLVPGRNMFFQFGVTGYSKVCILDQIPSINKGFTFNIGNFSFGFNTNQNKNQNTYGQNLNYSQNNNTFGQNYTYGQNNTTLGQNNNTFGQNYNMGQTYTSGQYTYGHNNNTFGHQNQNYGQNTYGQNLTHSQNNNTYGYPQNNTTFGQNNNTVNLNNSYQYTSSPRNDFGIQLSQSQSQTFNPFGQQQQNTYTTGFGQQQNTYTTGFGSQSQTFSQTFNNQPRYSLNIQRLFNTLGKRHNDTRSFDHQSYIPTNTPYPIRQIKLYGAQYVHGLQVSYEITGSSPLEIGYQNNNLTERVLNFETGEFIIEVSGRAGDFIDQLEIKTNLGRTICVGGTGGVPFRLAVPYNSQIVGFFGGVGGCLHTLGIFYG